GTITGVNSTNTVTIKPYTSITPTISGTNGSSLFILNGANWFIFDGSNTTPSSSSKNLTITNNFVGAGSSAFIFQSDASNDTIKNCKISGANSTATSGLIIFGNAVASTGNGNDNDFISNCDIGANGNNALATAIYS